MQSACHRRAPVQSRGPAQLGDADDARLRQPGDEFRPCAELGCPGPVGHHRTAHQVVVRDEVVRVRALEDDDFQLRIRFDSVHENVEFGEHLRVVEVDRRILDDHAPIGWRDLGDRQTVLCEHQSCSLFRPARALPHGRHRRGRCACDQLRQLLARDQKECTSSPGGPMSAAPFGSCACAIVSGLKVSRSNLILPASATRYPVNR